MTHTQTKSLVAYLFVCILVLSVCIPFVGATGHAGHAEQDVSTELGRYQLGASSAAQLNETNQTKMNRPRKPAIDPALLNSTGTTVVVVRLHELDSAMAARSATTSPNVTIQTLKRHAERSQQAVISYAKTHGGNVDVLNRFWLTNAVVLRVDTDRISLKRLVRLQGVERVHANFKVTVPTPEENATADSDAGGASVEPAVSDANGYNTTYGLAQINATQVWEEYGTKGAGVKVAVLDTGVAVEHPDITLFTTDPGNETYPGGWAEFDSQGDIVPGSVPHDTDTHGTHTSGTVSGGNASGEYIGVAPNVSLMHGLVLPGGSGTFAQVLGGMQWAVAHDADVMSMSLGVSGVYIASFIEPIRNAHAAGTFVVASVGNRGPGTSGSPGNVFDTVAVGATDRQLDVPFFSSGEVINTSEAWGDAAPAYWPDSYVVPDVVAPGVQVKSAVPGGGYTTYSGTSMSAPHVAGTIALMLSAAGGDLSVEEVKTALYQTAWKPDECVPSCDPREGNDTRYGAGIINAAAATDIVAAEQGIVGTVTDANGNPIAGATVVLDMGRSIETNASGMYVLRTEPGTYTVTVSEFGYETANATVTVENGTFTTQNITLAESIGVRLIEEQLPGIEGGENASVTFEVVNLDTYTVELTGNYSTANATLTVNGIEHEFGEPINLEGYAGELTITVETTDGTTGAFSLVHTFTGAGETVTRTTGPTNVFGEYTDIAVVDTPTGTHGDAVVAALRDSLSERYRVRLITTDRILSVVGQYDAVVVQNFGNNPEFVRQFLDTTHRLEIGVVVLDQFGAESNAIPQLSAATGNPESTSSVAFSGNPPVFYNITDTHPIFDGVATPGERVVLYRAQEGFFTGLHSWFEGYGGTVLATIGANERGISGMGLGVNEFKQRVLASSLGRSSYVENGAFKPVANQILANAVRYTSETPPIYLASETPDKVVPGDEFQLTFHVHDLEQVTVALDENSTLSPDDLTLYVNGQRASFGEQIDYEQAETDQNFTVTIETAPETVGSVKLDFTFVAGENNRTITGDTALIPVYDDVFKVPQVVPTIQQAVKIVPPGTTIVVGEGIYAEQVLIGTPNITLRNASGASPVIKLPEGHSFRDPFYVTKITADNVTIDGINMSADIEGFYSGPNLVIAADGTRIENSKINDGFRGIELHDADSTHIENVLVTNVATYGATGIRGSGDDITITDSMIRDSYNGIVITGQRTTVSESVFANIEEAAIRFEFGFPDNSGHISENVIRNVGTGVFLYYDEGAVVENNTVTNATTGIHLNAGAEPKTVTRNTIMNSTVGVQLGTKLFGGANVTLNEVDAETGILVDARFGDPEPAFIHLRYNDLASTEIAVKNTVDEPVDARLNYYGPRGPVKTTLEGDVVYDPFLIAPPEQITVNTVTAIGTDLFMPAGEAYALGVPGPTDQTIWEILGEDFEGTVYRYHVKPGKWKEIKGNGKKSRVSALDAFKVVPETDTRVVITFQRSAGVPPGHRDKTPMQIELEEGWNFVAAPQYAPIETAFENSTAEIVKIQPALGDTTLVPPQSQLGPRGKLNGTYRFGTNSADPTVSAFTGYFVYVRSDGTLWANLSANPTVDELYDSLSIEPALGPATSTAVPTLEAVIETATPEERAAIVDALKEVYDGPETASGVSIRTALKTHPEETITTAIRTAAPDERQQLVASLEAAFEDDDEESNGENSSTASVQSVHLGQRSVG